VTFAATLDVPFFGTMLPVAAFSAPDRSDWQGDERAIIRFRAGDVLGFEQIVRHYSSMLFSLAARMVGPGEAEDIVQETFLRAYRGLDTFRGESSLKTWLFAIALNRIRARRGTLAKLRSIFATGRVTDEDDGSSLIDTAVDGAASPEENTLSREQLKRLHAAVKELPEDFRVAVVLRDMQGLSYQEVAETLNVPIGTVRSRIARGRAILKERLT
jgi:RNA polymerase sigma-70 factor (ECF subfamily)